MLPFFRKLIIESDISPANESSLVHQILIVICCIFIFYLVGFSYWKPAFDKLTVDEVLSSDLNDPHDLSVGVVLVSHVKDETVGSVTDMNLEHFV